MTYNISVNFGDLWSALSAIGTILASAIALWLAYDERKKKLSASFVWAGVDEFKAKVLVANSSRKIIVLRSIDFKYQGKLYPGVKLLEDFHYKNSYILLPNTTKEILFSMPNALHDKLKLKELAHKKDVTLDNKYLKQSGKKRKMTILITDNSGKKYKTAQKFSVADLMMLFFGEALFR